MNLHQQMILGDYQLNAAILLILAKDKHEFMLSEKGFSFVKDGLEILRSSQSKYLGAVEKIFSEGDTES